MRSRYSRTAILLLAASIALMMTGLGIVMPVFARRLGELGGGVEALGLMTMAFGGAQFFAAPFMGSLADRIGRRPPILIALKASIHLVSSKGERDMPLEDFFVGAAQNAMTKPR